LAYRLRTITFREIENIATGKLVPNMSNGAVISREFIQNAKTGHHRLPIPSTSQAVKHIVKAAKKRLGLG
jgi:hypothetical protein